MSLLNPIEELINYIISHIHEGLLMNKLDNQQLKSNISEGTYILQNVDFNSKSINQSLPYSPIHLQSARTSKMNLFLPSLLKILDSPIKIRFTELELNLISAKNSGDSVSLTQSIALNKSDETPGLNVMTKSIGKFLSTINIEIVLFSINLSNGKHSINIQIPKLTISEENDEKSFRVEGFSVYIDKFEPILIVNEVIQGTFKFNSSEFEICLKMPDLFINMTYAQLEILLEILGGLKVTDKFDESESELIGTFNKIGSKVDLGPAIKKQAGLVTFSRVDFILTKFKPSSVQLFYDRNLHEKLQVPHFHLQLLCFEVGFGDGIQANVTDFFVDFYNVVEENSEHLFKSINETFFHEFFIQDTKEIVQGKICYKKIVQVKGGAKCLIEDDIVQVSIGSVKVRINSVVFAECMEISRMFEENTEKTKKIENSGVNTILKIQKIGISYQQELNEHWMEGMNLAFNIKFMGISVTFNDKQEIEIAKVLGSLNRVNEKFSILDLQKIFIQSVNRPFQPSIEQANKKYSAFFEPNQGCITIANTKTTEKKGKYKQKEEENSKTDFESEVITRISCCKCQILLGKQEIFNIFLLNLPVYPKESEKSSVKRIYYKTVVNVRETSFKFCDFYAQIGNMDLISSKNYSELSVSEFCLSSKSSKIYSFSDKPIILTYSKNVFKVKLKDFIVNSKIFEEFSSISLDLPEKKQSANKEIIVIKVLLYNCSLVISNNSAYAILLLEHCRLLTFSQDFSCGSIKISSFKIFYSNEKLPDGISKSLISNEGLRIFASGSCISAELSYQFTCYSRNCRFVSDDFYCAEYNADQLCKFSIFSSGTIIFHVCKDTFDVLEGLAGELSFKSQQNLNDSLYFEAHSSLVPKQVFHVHHPTVKFPEKSYESYSVTSVSNIFIHVYPENEFPVIGQAKKSFFYQIIPKIHEIYCVYFTTKTKACALSIEISDVLIKNCIKGCEIKNFLYKENDPKSAGNKFLKLQVLSDNPLSNTEEIALDISFSPSIFTFDFNFIEFFLTFLTNDSPELISESKPSIKIRTLNADPIKFTINYLQPGTNMLNLLNTENFQINLPKFEGQNIENIEQAIQQVLNFYQFHLEKHKILTLITRLSPVVSVSNITKALIRLAKSPFDPYSEEGAKQGVKTLLKVFSIESLKFCDSFLIGLSKLAKFRVNQPFSVKFQRTMKYF